MQFTTWSQIIQSSIKKEEAPTPESLRAAAKVLEEKAKELEKPKLTDKEDSILRFAHENGIDVVKKLDNGNYKYIEEDPSDPDYGRVWGREFVFERTIANGLAFSDIYIYSYIIAAQDKHDAVGVFIVL